MNLQTVGIAGLGLLGRGIAGCLLAHGLRVIAYTPSQEEFATARRIITEAIEELITRAGMPASLRDTWPERFIEVDSTAALVSADFVIESIVESAEAKQRLFDALEAVLPSTVTIASNTSAIPISSLQHGRLRPERFIGMHWAEPAHATRFLEIIRGNLTSDVTVRQALYLARLTGKEPCVVEHDLPGFIANRIGYAMYREACNLLALGIADAETIDLAFRNSVGLWAGVCGPFRWIDLTGGPALYARAMEPVMPTLCRETDLPAPLANLAASGCTGVNSGKGFYEYTEADTQRWKNAYRENVWAVHRTLQSVFPPQPNSTD
jgi:3-hydroxybutyryl-CoA dehydrogenase